MPIPLFSKLHASNRRYLCPGAPQGEPQPQPWKTHIFELAQILVFACSRVNCLLADLSPHLVLISHLHQCLLNEQSTLRLLPMSKCSRRNVSNEFLVCVISDCVCLWILRYLPYQICDIDRRPFLQKLDRAKITNFFCSVWCHSIENVDINVDNVCSRLMTVAWRNLRCPVLLAANVKAPTSFPCTDTRETGPYSAATLSPPGPP